MSVIWRSPLWVGAFSEFEEHKRKYHPTWSGAKALYMKEGSGETSPDSLVNR